MKNRVQGTYLVCFLAFSICSGFAGAAVGSVERIPLLEAPVPAYPVALMDRPIYEGHAVVGCLVAADGAVLETWAMRASHRAFADSAERAIREWRYAPAPTGADQMVALPVRVDLVRINYSLTGSIISQTRMALS